MGGFFIGLFRRMRSNKNGSVTVWGQGGNLNKPNLSDPVMNLSPQQIRSIKNSPKGVLPRFITLGIGSNKPSNFR